MSSREIAPVSFAYTRVVKFTENAFGSIDPCGQTEISRYHADQYLSLNGRIWDEISRAR